MDIVVSHRNGRVPITIFQIQGEITAESAEDLEQQAQEAFEAGTRNLLLDLTHVTFVSTIGLRAIHQTFVLSRASSAEESYEDVRHALLAGTYRAPHLKLLNPTPSVLQMLKVTGYDMFLEIHSDLDQALASF